MTLIQAQRRFIDRVNSCHSGHYNRVKRSAWKELYRWAEVRGFWPEVVCRDALDMAELERNAED